MEDASMKTKFFKWIPASLALCLAVMAAMGRGQAPAPSGPPDANGNRMYGRGPDGGGPGDGGGNFVRFIGAEAMLGDKLITGSPFSADVVREFKQTLSDGTLIDRKTTGKLARDSQGRTRSEITPPAIGPFATSGAPTIILINDAVAHKHYALNPKDKTARELGPAPHVGGMGHGEGHGEVGYSVRGGPGGRDGRGGGAGKGGGHDGMRGGEPVTVSLGSKTIDGVTVNGTRTTRTIPAGAIGNEKAIEIVFERWYSPDLLTDVMTKRSDPFSGESTFQLTNIKREEPAASWFQVPSDYKMEARRPGMGGMGGRNGAGMGPGMHRGGHDGQGGGPSQNQNPPAPPPSDPPTPGQGPGQNN
jgi:hypothetical protein